LLVEKAGAKLRSEPPSICNDRTNLKPALRAANATQTPCRRWRIEGFFGHGSGFVGGEPKLISPVTPKKFDDFPMKTTLF